MNPLVEQMLTTKSRNDLELAMLEQTFEEDCRCESEHVWTKCSLKVTHRANTVCGLSANLCETAATNARYDSQRPGTWCGYCNQPHRICVWTIRPI